MKTHLILAHEDGQRPVVVETDKGGRFKVLIDGRALEVDACPTGPNAYHLLHAGEGFDLEVEPGGAGVIVRRAGAEIHVPLLDEQQAARLAATGANTRRRADGTLAISAPMPGKVVKVLVSPGDGVDEGQGVIVIEAMKMENELRALAAGEVKKVLVNEGDSVESGAELILIE